MQNVIHQAIAKLNQIILGKETEVKLAFTCMLARGHLLIEDLPGMGKTTLAHGLADVLGLSYQRIQFTSDMLPADILGVSIFDDQTKTFSFHKGSVFNQVVLGDEINRASPKTQSALLEAMEEQQVSIDGNRYELPSPFFVIATQNPVFHAGTYPLPESQLDRFMMRISIGFPELAAELAMLKGEQLSSTALGEIDIETVIQLQTHVDNVYASDSVLKYIIALCQHTREPEFQGQALSPRATKAILQASKSWAMIEGRDHVLPEDVQAVFASVADHRLGQFTESSKQTSAARQIIMQVEAP